jgi:hypothetical protein
MNPSPDISSLLPDPDDVRRRREALVAEARADSDAPSAGAVRRRWIRTLVAVGAGATLSLGGLAGAAALFSGSDVDVSAGTGCYDSTDLENVSISIIRPSADPVAACRGVWRSKGTTKRVPPMIACSSEGGAVRVFPSSDRSICRKLDLRPLPKDYAPIGARAAAIRDAVAGLEDLTDPCHTVDGLSRTVRVRLQRANISGVPVTVVRNGGSCAFAEANGTEVRIYDGPDR